jgi:uncharacterized protein (TIGR03032 family)
MPHSPRWHGGKLWLIDSGLGFLGTVDPESGSFERKAFLPGYGRGLAFTETHAIVGISLPRENNAFSGLALDESLKRAKIDPRCAVLIINLESGDVEHWLQIEGLITELYDVAVIPGAKRPMAIGYKGEDIQRVLLIGEGPDGNMADPSPEMTNKNYPIQPTIDSVGR